MSQSISSAKPSPTMIAPTDPQSNSPFNKVPLEVLLRISSHLTTEDLGALRLTCRSLEQSMFNTFMKEFFSKRQFMLTEYSLQALVDISKSRLSDCLSHVIIGLNSFGPHYFGPHDHERETRYREAQADHLALVSSGQDVAMLAEAFQNLKNLEIVGIRDYHSHERTKRDGHMCEWSSYGATTIKKETGVDTLRAAIHESQAYANKVMITLLTALGNAGVRPKAFEWLRKQQGVPTDDAFNLFTKYLKPKVVPVLQGIESFLMAVNVSSGPSRATFVPGRPGDVDGNRYDYLLRQFLGYLPNAKHIRLNFHPQGGNNDCVDRFMTWLGAPLSKVPSTAPPPHIHLPTPPPPVAFPHLKRLDLGTVDVDPKRLIQVIRKFAPTLKELELHRITLLNRAAEGHSGADGRDHQKVNLWAKMLKALHEVPGLDLEHIKINMPSQRTFTMNNRAWFHRKDGPPDEKLMSQEYTGIDWKHFVEELASRVKMDIPPDTDTDEDDEDSDSSELDEDMMDDDMFMMLDQYYPDDVAETLEELEEMLLLEAGFDPAMLL